MWTRSPFPFPCVLVLMWGDVGASLQAMVKALLQQ